jgi:hypothetical protein
MDYKKIKKKKRPRLKSRVFSLKPKKGKLIVGKLWMELDPQAFTSLGNSLKNIHAEFLEHFWHLP